VRRGGALAPLALVTSVVGAAHGEDVAPTLAGSLAAGAWASSRSADDETGFGVGRFVGKLTGRLGDSLRFGFEARVWSQDATRGEDHTRGELREGWVQLALGEQTEVRAGKQLATWGRADGINPTDLLNARDFTRLVPDDHDTKLGAWALRATRYLGDLALTALWIVDFEPHRLPLAASPPGVTVTQDLPAHEYRQVVLRLETMSETIDASISYFDGYDHVPDLRLDGANVALVYPRIRVIGADAAKNFGRFGVRVEASYTFQDRGVALAPLPERRDVAYVVAGFDRSFFEYLSLNVQYVGRYLNGFTPPGDIADEEVRAIARSRSVLIQQHRRAQHGVSLRIANQWLHETLEVELKGLVWLAQGDFVLSPKLTYAVSDRLGLTAGADYYHGPANSSFGQVESNRTAFLELKWSF
jgi:hypothetical protein